MAVVSRPWVVTTMQFSRLAQQTSVAAAGFGKEPSSQDETWPRGKDRTHEPCPLLRAPQIPYGERKEEKGREEARRRGRRKGKEQEEEDGGG